MAISEQELREVILGQGKGKIAIEVNSQPVASFTSGDASSIAQAAKKVAHRLTDS